MKAYAQRSAAPAGGADRLLAWLGFAGHSLVHGRLQFSEALMKRVARRSAQLRGQPLRTLLPPLRYQLRRAGSSEALIAESFAVFCAALSEDEARQVSPDAFAAARRLAHGGIVELADARQRGRALQLAAFALALEHDSAHVLSATQRAADAFAESLRAPLAALGLPLGLVTAAGDAGARRQAYGCAVVCAVARDAALDYLRDRTLAGRGKGAFASGEKPLHRGLHCALVEDAAVVMLDEAPAPIAIARDVDVSQERLLYDQALELARALQPQTDFDFDEEGVRLTDAASELLGRLVAPLGGVWAARERREELIGLALQALHVLQRGADYRVEQGRVLFPPRPPEEAEAAAERDAVILKLVEAKEGCAFSARRELVARISMPVFLGRYLHLAGACGDALGLAREFWSLYSLKTSLAGARAGRPTAQRRLFTSREAKRAALLQTVLRLREAGKAVMLAARTTGEAAAAESLLREAGIPAGEVPVSLAPAERNVEPAARSGMPLTMVVIDLHDSGRQVAQIMRAYGASHGEVLLSLDEEAIALHLGGWARLAWLRAAPDGEVAQPWGGRIAGLAERRMEAAQALMRRELAARDQHMHDLLAFSGAGH